MKITFEIDENKVLQMLRDYYEERITMEMVKDIVLKDEGVIANIYMWGHDETETRSACVDAIVHKLMGLRDQCLNYHWPCYGDSDEYKTDFHTKWDKAMTKNTGDSK